MTEDEVMRSRAFADDAIAYFWAAKKVLAGETIPGIIAVYRMPANFLLAQCCELVLKTLLASLGWTEDRWVKAKIGHDLLGLVDALNDEKYPLDTEFVKYCEIMGPAHKIHHFRYPGRKGLTFVDPRKALTMIDPQVRAIAHLGLIELPDA